MGFIRRFSTFPSAQVISQIEGVVIVDTPPPSTIEGVSTGVVGVVGEFADLTSATYVDGSGNVTSKPQPVYVTSAQDMLNKVGGWDATLGDFGGEDGNGYAAVANKRFSQLVLCPVNLASSKAVRVWRELPTNKSATDATPVVPMAAATVAAGTKFTDGTNQVALGATISFTADGAIASGTDGVQTSDSGTSLTFTSDSATFQTKGVKVGDALVVGVLGSVTGDPGTYRIIAINSETSLEVESLNGTSVTWDNISSLPWRIHPARTFDTGGNYVRSNNAGFTLPARCMSANIAQALALAAVNPAASATANSWSPLSGLAMATQTLNGLTFTAAQAANYTGGSAMDALYKECFEAFLSDISPARDVSVIAAARTSDTIRAALRTHVQSASAYGKGRMAVVAPKINVTSQPTVTGDSAPGVGATRDERVIYCWPGTQTQIAEAVNSSIKTAIGTYTTDGILDVRADMYMASILSNLAAERNPGQSADPVPLCLSSALGLQRGLTTNLTMADYILFKQSGIAALREDRVVGKVFQSGITSSMISGQKNINRRRMADEIQDSLAAAYEQYTKLPLTTALKDAIDGATVAYLNGLLSPNNPAAQRIEAYSVDSKSGNTPELNAQGIYVVIVRVRMLATSDDIVLQAEVGPTVNISTT